jgi:hypothetical protein
MVNEFCFNAVKLYWWIEKKLGSSKKKKTENRNYISYKKYNQVQQNYETVEHCHTFLHSSHHIPEEYLEIVILNLRLVQIVTQHRGTRHHRCHICKTHNLSKHKHPNMQQRDLFILEVGRNPEGIRSTENRIGLTFIKLWRE